MPNITFPQDPTYGIDPFDSRHVLYFFEPQNDRSILSLAVDLSSLATLSEFSETNFNDGPLYAASINTDMDMARLLVDSGANVNVNFMMS